MKTFIAAISAMIIMLTGICLYIGYLTDITDEMIDVVKHISDFAKNESWNECNSKIDELINLWECNERILCSFTDHSDLDEVKRSMKELKESANYNDAQNTVMYSSVLLVLIDRLTENELPTPENILKDKHTYEAKRIICYNRHLFIKLSFI